MKYIWQDERWPALAYDARAVDGKASEAAYRLGLFRGSLSRLGFEQKSEAGLWALSSEIVASAAIEGEDLNRDDVRSSVARRMEIVLKESRGAVPHGTEARVEMMTDATRGWERPMTLKRLFAWHAALFPTGYSGLSKIHVGRFRSDADGPMRVVSRHGMLERVHFEAPPAERLAGEMKAFLKDLNAPDPAVPGLVRAALAHLRFLTLHPFDDGNGRLARALTEYSLARLEESGLRFYSLSAQIQKDKSAYYDALQKAQRGTLDQTQWILWFLDLHGKAIASAEESLAGILRKARFWQEHASDAFTPNQREILNRLFDGFTGHLTSSKWAKICKVSQDTASREIRSLLSRGLLVQQGQGRSTHYTVRLER